MTEAHHRKVLDDTQEIDMPALLLGQILEELVDEDKDVNPEASAREIMAVTETREQREMAAKEYRKLSKPLYFQLWEYEQRGESPPRKLQAKYDNYVDMADRVRNMHYHPGPGLVATLAALIRNRRKPAA